MSTETDTHSRFGVSREEIASKAVSLFRVVGPIALLGTFMIGYSLSIVVLAEVLDGTGFFSELHRLAQIFVSTTVGMPITASMVLAARYSMSLVGEMPGDSWEEAVVVTAGATWLLMPPLLYVWPSVGMF